MTPRKPLILLKKSGAFAFQLVSRPTTKSRHFGGEIDGSRGGKTSKFLHLEVAESRPEFDARKAFGTLRAHYTDLAGKCDSAVDAILQVFGIDDLYRKNVEAER